MPHPPRLSNAARYATPQECQDAVTTSEVRQQRNPDHAPSGAKLSRRAIQLGLRESLLRAFAMTELLDVIDMTDFVAQQRAHAQDDNPQLVMPLERAYQRQPYD